LADVFASLTKPYKDIHDDSHDIDKPAARQLFLELKNCKKTTMATDVHRIAGSEATSEWEMMQPFKSTNIKDEFVRKITSDP
jgi:hypothetical protein